MQDSLPGTKKESGSLSGLTNELRLGLKTIEAGKKIGVYGRWQRWGYCNLQLGEPEEKNRYWFSVCSLYADKGNVYVILSYSTDVAYSPDRPKFMLRVYALDSLITLPDNDFKQVSKRYCKSKKETELKIPLLEATLGEIPKWPEPED